MNNYGNKYKVKISHNREAVYYVEAKSEEEAFEIAEEMMGDEIDNGTIGNFDGDYLWDYARVYPEVTNG